MEMERAHSRENFRLGFDASHLLQLSTNRFFRLNGKQPETIRANFEPTTSPFVPNFSKTFLRSRYEMPLPAILFSNLLLDGKFRVCWMIKSSSERLQELVATIKVFLVVSCVLLLTCFLSTRLEMFKRESKTILLFKFFFFNMQISQVMTSYTQPNFDQT